MLNNYEDNSLNMPQFFDLKEEDLQIVNPYDFNAAIKRLENLTDEELIDDMSCFQKKNFDLVNREIEATFSIDNIKFLTSKKESNGELNLTILEDLEKFIEKKDENEEEEENDNLNLTFKRDKQQIIIKCKVNYKLFVKNIFENMCKKSFFKDDVEQLLKIVNEKAENNYSKQFYFDIFIKNNSILDINYNEEFFLFNLQHPPNFKTNFLNNFKDENEDGGKKFENIIFPFRNFNDEMANLKYKRFFILIYKKKIIPDINFMFNVVNKQNNINNKKNEENHKKNFHSIIDYLPNIFKPEDKEKKIIFNEKITFLENTEKLIQKKHFHFNEISDYFKYNSNEELKQIFIEFKFINNNQKLFDIELIKFYYLILAIISENILSYFNCIEFIENLFYKKKNYKKILNVNDNNLFPIFFNETLNRILDTHQNIGTELIIEEFEQELIQFYQIVQNEFNLNGLDYVIRPGKNPNLMRIQRIIVTPTFSLFTPYVLDQGNRILRNFLESPYLSMICVFKLDDFNEGKWNNKFLIEFIKFILSKGYKMCEKDFKFFDYSQSQFRNMSCWLLTEPEKILPKTGDYSNIKIVAKYGARISQTLTTTIKTISIPEDKIEEIDDVVVKNNKNEVIYTFSDGVGRISYILAEKIAKFLHLNNVPAAFQGRFLGCKGVWTTMYEDFSGKIYIRPSQKKFIVKPEKNDNYFELCDYSRYIQAYLNRQIILLMRTREKKDENFIKKLDDYKKNLENEKFVLSLIHYEQWNNMFKEIYNNGINMNNDRLINSLIDKNKEILYTDLKTKARIYIDQSAYVIGILDEFGVLEYGEAYLHIKRKNLDLVLDRKCVVAKCPCLHPGDLRELTFKKYIPNKSETHKYKRLLPYENVIIFPQKGPRPHSNELSGSDLDGDNYFIFYDADLIGLDDTAPMNYNIEIKNQKKYDKITLNDVIKYYAEYTNLNNLGIIGDAHLAMADNDINLAKGQIPLNLAMKFSRAVDAPKTGDDVTLDEKEKPKKFPHYMEGKKNTYKSNTILGQLYDRIEKLLKDLGKNKFNEFYDEDLMLKNWKNFAFLACFFYKDYFEEIINLLRKNEVGTESTLLTGNNTDNEESIFTKKKHNYDIREKVTTEMIEIFNIYTKDFYNALDVFFGQYEISLKDLNNEISFINNLNNFSSACYIICYNLFDICSKRETELKNFKDLFTELILNCLIKEDDIYNLEMVNEYETENLGIENYYENFDYLYNDYCEIYEFKRKKILDIIESQNIILKDFLNKIANNYHLPNNPDDENQSRILSFPWCISGKMLSTFKVLVN